MEMKNGNGNMTTGLLGLFAAMVLGLSGYALSSAVTTQQDLAVMKREIEIMEKLVEANCTNIAGDISKIAGLLERMNDKLPEKGNNRRYSNGGR